MPLGGKQRKTDRVYYIKRFLEQQINKLDVRFMQKIMPLFSITAHYEALCKER